jgi:hypothetical protein
MSYSEIAHNSSSERIKKILGLILDGKIIVLQGKLEPEEETRLIEDTMALIGNVKGFKGIEIASMSNNGYTYYERFKEGFASWLVGKQNAMTIIGPANLVKEIKKNPKKIELLLKK